MKVKPNFWFKASKVKLDFQADFDYMIYLNDSTLHKGMETIFGPGIKIEVNDKVVRTRLSTYYKGENYGPTFQYFVPKDYYRQFTPYLYANMDLMYFEEERYEVKGKSFGKFRQPNLAHQNDPGFQGYYIDSKKWFNYIKSYSSGNAEEYWYIDGELQDFGRILYKDKTYKFVKFNFSNESEYEEVNKKEVDFKSYVDKELWEVDGVMCRAFTKEFKPNIKNKDIIIKITELKEDGELFATDINIEIKGEVTTLRIYANPEECDEKLYFIEHDSIAFEMRKKRATYTCFGNDGIIEDVVIHHENDYFQKYLKEILDSKYLESSKKRGKTVLGYNKIYNNISYAIKKIDYKSLKCEEYLYDKYMYFYSANENGLQDGRLLKIEPNGAVFEQFYDNGEEISDYEFVEYIKSIDEIDEY